MSGSPGKQWGEPWLLAAWVVPALHPVLIPYLGPPSHLLWWVHVLPVARLSYDRGRPGALVGIGASTLLVMMGERAFGEGYGMAASWETALSLAVSLFLTHLLVAAFALHARRIALQYRVLLAGLHVGVIVMDARERVVTLNRRAASLLGTDEMAARDRPISDLVSIEGVSSMEAAGSLGSGSARARIPGEGGAHVVPVFWVAIPHPDGEGWQLLLADRSADVLRESEAQQKARLAVLGQAMATLAHEFRNPLTTIFLEVEMAGDADYAASEALSGIRGQALRMNAMVDDLLGFSRRREEGASRLPVLVRRVVRVQGLAAGRRVKIVDDCRGEATLAVPEGRLEQVLLNLVGNAVDALQAQGGTVRVGCSLEGPDVAIVVEDDGPGIPPEHLRSIFDPFFTTKPEGQGTGLGLAIARELIEEMGGTLAGNNRREGGARFEIRLPATLMSEDDSHNTGTPSSTRHPPREPDPLLRHST